MTEPDILCGACGQTVGTNKDCQDCLSFLVDESVKDFDEESARRTAEDAGRWEQGRGKDAPKDLVERFRLGANMVNDYVSGRYRKVPWRTVASVVAGLVYVINPLDLVPDFIAGLGWVDDMSMLGFIFQAFSGDLEDYRLWREARITRKKAGRLAGDGAGKPNH